MKLINTPPHNDIHQSCARLWENDTSLWSEDPSIQKLIKNRLGWIPPKPFALGILDRVNQFSEIIKSESYQQVILLGMGGSSLAPEVYSRVFPENPGYPTLIVLDSTSPSHVKRISEQTSEEKTLFIVASKSGTTAETAAFHQYFYEQVGQNDSDPGKHFIAITDSGSELEALAKAQNFRDVFINPSDIGGRYSALSYFGLVPAALLGIDISKLISFLPDSADDTNVIDAAQLGFVMGSLNDKGVDKLTLLLNDVLQPLGPWVEQLIDESTGKLGKGITVITDELVKPMESYSDDRLFVCVDTPSQPIDDSVINALQEQNKPMIHWTLSDVYELGSEFFKWEIATAIAGEQMAINPFDEPNVNESKSSTREILSNKNLSDIKQEPQTLSLNEFFSKAKMGDYCSILAFLPPSAELENRCRAWCNELSNRLNIPCTFSFGPRYLHSSGQLHKGGPNNGLYLFLTLPNDKELEIPGQPHGFQSLITAQAFGDIDVLKKRDRRVHHIALDNTEDHLAEVIKQTL